MSDASDPAPQPSARSRGGATRQQMLDVAAELFADRGYEATSFSDLIAASGMSKGAFYFHFSSKRELALAVLRDRQQRLQEAVTDRVDPTAPALARFEQLWIGRAQVLEDDPSLRCLRKLAVTFGDAPEVAEELTGLHRGPITLMSDLLTQAQAEGDLRGDVDPLRAASVAFDAAIGIDEISDRETGGADIVERARAFLDVFLRGVTPTQHQSHQSADEQGTANSA